MRTVFETKPYLKAFLTGLTAMTLPTFYHNPPLAPVPEELLSDRQKVAIDYQLSLSGIKKEVKNFERKHKH